MSAPRFLRGRTRRAYFVAVYFLSWLIFGAVGLVLNLGCALLLLVPGRKAFAPVARATIRQLFEAWLNWLHACGVVEVTWHGFDATPLSAGTVYVANHPTLIDATFLLARLPDAVCIFKPSLIRNPAIGPAAIVADYAAGEPGVDLLRSAAEKVAAGRSLLIFPEGTRTWPGTILGAMKPGFALIADRARAPVQLILLRASPELVPRGRSWLRPPSRLPASLHIFLDQSWPYEPGRSATELTQAVERRVLAALAQPPLP